MDTSALFEDLFSWETSARQQDEQLKSLRSTGAAEPTGPSAPVRSGAPAPKQIAEAGLKPSQPPKTARIEEVEVEGETSARHTYDNYQ
eukprot:SAG11_NODE_8_length_31217_cov_52.169677_20_plen_88_part_00